MKPLDMTVKVEVSPEFRTSLSKWQEGYDCALRSIRSRIEELVVEGSPLGALLVEIDEALDEDLTR